MIKNEKAMTAEDRILSVVTDIKNIKDRKGIASQDAVRVILNKWWIPSNSKIAVCLKGWACSVTSNQNASVTDIANDLIIRSAKVNDCYKRDIIHEIPSNGFKLPEGANLVLGQLVWYPRFDRKLNKIYLECGTVIGIHLNPESEYYDILINNGDYKEWYDVYYRSEKLVFFSKLELTKAIKNNFI